MKVTDLKYLIGPELYRKKHSHIYDGMISFCDYITRDGEIEIIKCSPSQKSCSTYITFQVVSTKAKFKIRFSDHKSTKPGFDLDYDFDITLKENAQLFLNILSHSSNTEGL